MAKKDHYRFDQIIGLFTVNLPLVLLLVWAIAQPAQSSELVKLVAAFLAGKGAKTFL